MLSAMEPSKLTKKLFRYSIIHHLCDIKDLHCGMFRKGFLAEGARCGDCFRLSGGELFQCITGDQVTLPGGDRKDSQAAATA